MPSINSGEDVVRENVFRIIIGIGLALSAVGVLGNLFVIITVSVALYGFGMHQAASIADFVVNHRPFPEVLLAISIFGGLFIAGIGFLLLVSEEHSKNYKT